MALLYRPEFWDRAMQLASIGHKQCEECLLYSSRKVGDKRTVRVVLAEEGKPMPHKLRLLCTCCFPDAEEVGVPRKVLLSKIGELFPDTTKEGKAAGA